MSTTKSQAAVRAGAKRCVSACLHRQARLVSRGDISWHTQAACRPGTGVDISGFFATTRQIQKDPGLVKRTLAVCDGCPVREACLQAAISGNEYGIWGGKTERSRRKVARTPPAAS